MSTARFLIGDTRDLLADVPDGSVDLIVTSPPFLALRSYLPADHPDKHREIGSEPTPADFLSTLLALTVEWRRVLAPHGSLCVELGDTYSGSGGAGGDYNADGLREGQPKFDGSNRRERNRSRDTREGRDGTATATTPRPEHGGGPGWPLAKSMCGIPTLYTWSLAYGRNLLRPEQTFAPWRIRNLLVWARPNPPVGALGDKFRPATSYITVACTSARRWFDLDAVRVVGDRIDETPGVAPGRAFGKPGAGGDSNRLGKPMVQNPAGAPPLDWHTDIDDGPNGDRLWVLPTAPYPGSHFATYPPELPARLIKAMCPMQVCTALVCRNCGTKHKSITTDTLWNIEMGREEDPEPGSVQEGMRRVRDLLREQESVHLLRALRPDSATSATELGASVEEDGHAGPDLPPGIHPAVLAGVSGGDDEGLRLGTPLRDGTEAWSSIDPAGARPSSERDTGRQSDRESGSRDGGESSGRSFMSRLRVALLDSLTCECGHAGFRVCGEPRRRIDRGSEYVDSKGRKHEPQKWASGVADGKGAHSVKPDGGITAIRLDGGWTDCGHGAWRNGLTFDPFCGSGTTLAAATGAGRDALGFDLDPRNLDLARERVGMFLEAS